MSRLVLVIPLLAFAAVALFFAFGLTRDPSRIPSELIDRPLPTFELPPIAGFEQGFGSADLTGDVVLVNIWGSWCVSCHIEHPLLMQLAQNKEIPIYGLNWKDDPQDAADWLERYGNPYTLIGADREGRVIVDLGVTGAPETFIVDRQGRVRYKHVGPITQDAWTDILAPLIKELRRS